jgi:hypothetical protein
MGGGGTHLQDRSRYGKLFHRLPLELSLPLPMHAAVRQAHSLEVLCADC